MPVKTQCPSCNSKLRVPDSLLGKSVKCPSCQEKFTVDEAVGEPPAETAVTTTPAKSKPAPSSYEAEDRPRPRRRHEKAAADEDDEVDDEEDYDDRPRRRKRRKARRRQEAASAVAGPAIALMIVGSLALVLSAVSLVLNLVGAALIVPQGGAQGGPDAIANAAGGVVGALFGLCWGGTIVGGAFNMYRLSNYGFAMTASIVAMVPCNLCCILGLPFGIWALVAMNRPDVKDAFR